MTNLLKTEPSWRASAARIVEELFPVVAQNQWDNLLDLRQSLLNEADWKRVLIDFAKCREMTEADHYLPFYRLRNLLCAHLRLEGKDGESLKVLLLRNRSVGELAGKDFRLIEV